VFVSDMLCSQWRVIFHCFDVCNRLPVAAVCRLVAGFPCIHADYTSALYRERERGSNVMRTVNLFSY